MRLALELGGSDLLLPLVGWVALFLSFSTVIGVFALRAARARLRAAGRRLGGWTVGLVVVQLVLGPLSAGYFGAMFSLHRSVAAILEDGGPKVVAWALGQADTGDPAVIVSVKELRERALREAAPPARDGAPPIARIRRVAKEGVWSAIAGALRAAPDEAKLTWGQVMARAGDVLVHEVLGRMAERFRKAARVSLYLLVGGLALLDGGSFGAVWLVTRRRRAAARPAAEG